VRPQSERNYPDSRQGNWRIAKPGVADRLYARLKTVLEAEFKDEDLTILSIGAENFVAEMLLAIEAAFDLRKQQPQAQQALFRARTRYNIFGENSWADHQM
jgi:hypothetical protein